MPDSKGLLRRLASPKPLIAFFAFFVLFAGYLHRNTNSNAWLSQRGYLYLKPDKRYSKHPIQHLIDDAQRKWDLKNRRQSKTLAQAVAEYKRRYGYPPPHAFDEWYQFATENNVQLIDDFDLIFKDIKPFLAIPPVEFRKRAEALISDSSNFFMGKLIRVNIKNHEWSSDNWHFIFGNISRMMDPLAFKLPDMDWMFWVHDLPIQHISGRKKLLLEQLAETHQYMSDPQLSDTFDNNFEYGWQAFCPPESKSSSLLEATMAHPTSFIQDHMAAMDICENPEQRQLHSVTLTHSNVLEQAYRAVDFQPFFSWCKLPGFAEMRVAYMHHFSDDPVTDIPWDQKTPTVYWRGGCSGMFFRKTTPWRLYPRPRFLALTHRQEGQARVMRPTLQPNKNLAFDTYQYKDLNSWFDTAFVYTTLCDETDGSCEDIKNSYHFDTFSNVEDANLHKFQFDMDGNGWSGRFRRLMLSDSVVLKSTIFSDWFQDRIQPWLHYVPVKIDYTDLFDILAYFRTHDDQAQKIGQAGKAWAQTNMRWVDLQAYNYRLLLEYARLLYRETPGRGSMDYLG